MKEMMPEKSLKFSDPSMERCAVSELVTTSETMSTIVESDQLSPVSTEPLILPTGDKGGIEAPCTFEVYPIRWVILALFVAYSMSNAFQWIQYSIIANIIADYYGVETTTVDWTSMIYMITYIPLIFPASWFLEVKGLRKSVLIGSFGTMLGAWIKCASVRQDLFWVSFLGQFVSAISQIFILGVPPRLAAVWFDAERVSTACAIGVFGNQLGVALGFLLPPIIVENSKDMDVVSSGLLTMFLSVAVICTVLFVLIVLVFKEAPPTPPSAAALSSSTADENRSYLQGIKRLMSNTNYLLLLVTYGMNVGVFYGISTLLNQTVLEYFPGETENAGRIGLVIVLSGMAGSVACGYILDRTAKFKFVTFGVYSLSLVFMIVYTFSLEFRIMALVFVTASALGFFMTGYLPVGFEFAAELTFPESEGTSSGLLNASAQVFGVICTLTGSQVLQIFTPRAVNLILCVILFSGSLMTMLIHEDLRRQAARQKAKGLYSDRV